jgi:acyl carrier protein
MDSFLDGNQFVNVRLIHTLDKICRMELGAFVRKLEAEFEELEPGTLSASTNYRQLSTWSSMHALIVIAFVDAEFDIVLKPEELRQTQTVEDLYNLVMRQR